jgi:hypothetical protein
MTKLHIFGSPCTYYDESPKQKLDARGLNGTYLGINTRSQSYYILTDKNTVISSRNVIIRTPDTQLTCTYDEGSEDDEPYIMPTDKEPSPEPNTTQPSTHDRPQRDRRPPPHLADYDTTTDTLIDHAYTALLAIPAIPETYEEAMNSDQHHQWKAAMD